MPHALVLRQAETVNILVEKADNWVGILVNGQLVAQFAHASTQVPQSGTIEITPHLGHGANVVSVVGVDWGGTAHLQWTVQFSGHDPINSAIGPRPSKQPVPHFGESAVETYLLYKT